MVEKGDPIAFSKFEGGKIIGVSGTYETSTAQLVTLLYEGKSYSFKRQPGPKCGWGVGPSKFWRLDESARRILCEKDEVRRR